MTTATSRDDLIRTSSQRVFPLMPSTASESVRLYGTDETVEPPRVLRAGPLSAELDVGNLRHIRYHGREMIRAISFIVRDKNWGTYAPRISQLDVQESPESFSVTKQQLKVSFITPPLSLAKRTVRSAFPVNGMPYPTSRPIAPVS